MKKKNSQRDFNLNFSIFALHYSLIKEKRERNEWQAYRNTNAHAAAAR
jgi:hypothetical protein